MLRLRSALLVAAGLAAGCSDDDVSLSRVQAGEAEVTGQGVLVIVVDGLRWDHTSLAKYDRDTTPYLARFARDAMVFTNAWSASSSLVGSHVAILSGCDPSLAQPPDVRSTVVEDAGVESESEGEVTWFVPEELWLLGRPFLGHGYRTAAFVDHPDIAELSGFDRGFRTFVEHPGEANERQDTVGWFGVGRRFIKWLNALPIDQDWFAYVHMNDLERVWFQEPGALFVKGAQDGVEDWKERTELQYIPPVGLTEPLFHALPPSRARRRGPETLAQYELRYDRGIRALDASLARLVGTAQDFGRADDITIVIAGSFGTGLGEHGLYLQAGLAEDIDLHVPLLVRPSKAVRDALGWEGRVRRKCDALVALVDVSPTLVDLAGVPGGGAVHGVSLRPLLDGSRGAVRSRVFARSAVVPGFAVIEADRGVGVGALRAAYDPAGAAPSVVRSWSRGQSNELGSEGDLEAAALWRDWDALMEQQRRALHFGLGSSDSPSDEVHAFQGVSVPDDAISKEGPPHRSGGG